MKLSSLIVKMLNRLIKDKILPREAINILIGQSHIFVQVLCSSSVLPYLMQRCERLGVGNVVGACFSNPVEASSIPAPGPEMELFDLDKIAKVSEHYVQPEPKTASMTETTGIEEEADYISSDDEDDNEAKKSVPSIVGVSFLSDSRKKVLVQKIIDARNEWLQTASTIRVEQVAEEVRAGAALTWDYLAFTVCAATVAAIGLGTDSATTTTASMLISP